MMKKHLSLAGIAALGALVWIGCSSDDSPSSPGGDNDAGTGSETDTDAGKVEEDSGSNDGGTKPGVDIAYGQCPAFEKCGGDVIGTWKVAGGCLSQDTFALAKEACEGLQERDVVIKAEGTVTVTATHVQRKTTIYVDGSVTVPLECSPIASCEIVASVLRGEIPLPGPTQLPAFKQATCTQVDGDKCDCTVSTSIPEDTNDPYTIADGTLTTTGEVDRSFEFCVEGTGLTFRETTQSEQTLPFVIELTKQ